MTEKIINPTNNNKLKTKKMATAAQNKNKARMTLIQSEANKLWATGKYKKYSEVVSKASAAIKKAGTL